MPQPPPVSPARIQFGDRFQRLGQSLGAREAEHTQGLEEARAYAEALRAAVASALADLHRAASDAGAPHLEIGLDEVRTDDKHLRAAEFTVFRGRYRAIVTVKSRGEVTLVGPFHQGKTEGPCRTFAFDAVGELQEALGDFIERFCLEAATP